MKKINEMKPTKVEKLVPLKEVKHETPFGPIIETVETTDQKVKLTKITKSKK